MKILDPFSGGGTWKAPAHSCQKSSQVSLVAKGRKYSGLSLCVIICIFLAFLKLHIEGWLWVYWRSLFTCLYSPLNYKLPEDHLRTHSTWHTQAFCKHVAIEWHSSGSKGTTEKNFAKIATFTNFLKKHVLQSFCDNHTLGYHSRKTGKSFKGF